MCRPFNSPCTSYVIGSLHYPQGVLSRGLSARADVAYSPFTGWTYPATASALVAYQADISGPYQEVPDMTLGLIYQARISLIRLI